MAARQLSLPLGFAPSYVAADFIADESNAEARAWLADPARWPGGRLALYGEAGRGKTHLLHLWAGRAGALLVDGTGMRRAVFHDGAVGVDDADLAEPEALLHTLNAGAEAGRPVLLAAREAPGRWEVALPDLRSRVRAMAAVELEEPSDAMQAALLARLLAEQQLTVAEAHQDWLLAHVPRSAAVLQEVVARLNRVSLARRRALTRGAMAEVVAGLDAE